MYGYEIEWQQTSMFSRLVQRTSGRVGQTKNKRPLSPVKEIYVYGQPQKNRRRFFALDRRACTSKYYETSRVSVDHNSKFHSKNPRSSLLITIASNFAISHHHINADRTCVHADTLIIGRRPARPRTGN